MRKNVLKLMLGVFSVGLFFNACKTDKVVSSHAWQKRKYRKGWHTEKISQNNKQQKSNILNEELINSQNELPLVANVHTNNESEKVINSSAKGSSQLTSANNSSMEPIGILSKKEIKSFYEREQAEVESQEKNPKIRKSPTGKTNFKEELSYEANDQLFPILSFVFGLLGFIGCWIPIVGTLFGAAGVVFGLLGLKSESLKGLSIAGMILGILALLTSILVLIAVFTI